MPGPVDGLIALIGCSVCGGIIFIALDCVMFFCVWQQHIAINHVTEMIIANNSTAVSPLFWSIYGNLHSADSIDYVVMVTLVGNMLSAIVIATLVFFHGGVIAHIICSAAALLFTLTANGLLWNTALSDSLFLTPAMIEGLQQAMAWGAGVLAPLLLILLGAFVLWWRGDLPRPRDCL